MISGSFGDGRHAGRDKFLQRAQTWSGFRSFPMNAKIAGGTPAPTLLPASSRNVKTSHLTSSLV